MAKKDKKILFESFGDRKSAILMGIFCYLYFGVMYLPESDWIAKILPLWPYAILGGLAFLTLIAQAVVWKLFKHYEAGWYRSPMALILFVCEFGLLFFTVLFFSWPLYGLHSLLTTPQHPHF